MHIHILGICGTFMAGVALLAREAGHTVTGSDANVYPPMSTQLEAQGITLMEGYKPEHLDPAPDMVVIGNVMSRGNPMVEHILEKGLPYTSGPEWLGKYILQDRWVLAVAGTHGKTTTSSMLAWILEYAGLTPGFLIGGIPQNFGLSARLGNTPFFVVEADEYDTAFFDKRSKFVHYHPRTLILNNLEFDHADIFPDLNAIKTQFHHLMRTVPGNGLIVANAEEQNIKEVIAMGCWTPVEYFGDEQASWQAGEINSKGSFDVLLDNQMQGKVEWTLSGRHNQLNALAAIAAARHAGVAVDVSLEALKEFRNVKRRMELRAEIKGIKVYDDFAHHPTAIDLTLKGLKKVMNKGRIIAVLEPRSNTMRMGVHKDLLADSLKTADEAYLLQPEDLSWDLKSSLNGADNIHVVSSVEDIVKQVKTFAKADDHVVIMSNGAFGGIHEKLIKSLDA
ncbi:MAG: UDP-N-acetylmuramate:L-alanyl-gamma-D-glutamyl-meso-diaminopimelate ligase [Gammaproteobacteria bacterium]|nr:UDP-N-acetylmuramate:L-alanyl-gamma-D-glutamyl-meso-diaminopimelate ligase [Gammaproteobacteria bacterium]MDH5593729.1 UDP-N-acetylmuramate:L-alanyl-gamma-D-glutamyl-meso-diaminopimelate ligase [Gammaproteobacteria bacterium]MDH5613918.1 UDP-N-acetylmuramate:L-alanyl-gamma-D-glutamyl-meso-diaminopimelate ligase [Gammaproteobacteria bacterium]